MLSALSQVFRSRLVQSTGRFAQRPLFPLTCSAPSPITSISSFDSIRGFAKKRIELPSDEEDIPYEELLPKKSKPKEAEIPRDLTDIDDENEFLLPDDDVYADSDDDDLDLSEEAPSVDPADAAQLDSFEKTLQVRLISTNGSQLGMMSLFAAKRAAANQNFECRKVSPAGVVPPVYKMTDKKAAEANADKQKKAVKEKVKQRKGGKKAGTTQEVRLTVLIAEGDIKHKIQNIRKLLIEKQRRVRVFVFYKARSVGNLTPADIQQKSHDLLMGILQKISHECVVESEPAPDKHRTYSMTVCPLSLKGTGDPKRAKAQDDEDGDNNNDDDDDDNDDDDEK